MTAPLRIATRKSPLALWQAERVRALLAARGQAATLVPMSTEGDRVQDRPLAQVGGKGLFVKELEAAIFEGRAELAVHSAKDVPYALPPGFVLAAILSREDPRDALVAPRARTLAQLPQGARVGTSSLRRAAQLLAARPDLLIVPVRGNVQTRLGKASARPGDSAPPLDAVVLALAGLRRLGLEGDVTEILDTSVSLPAAGQGALAIETLRGSVAAAAVASLDDEATARCVRAERSVLVELSGSCTLPLAAHAVIDGAELYLRAAVGGAGDDGKPRLVRAELRGPAQFAERIGVKVAEALLAAGAGALIEAARLTAP